MRLMLYLWRFALLSGFVTTLRIRFVLPWHRIRYKNIGKSTGQ